MKRGLYLRLALQGIGKNRKIYIPYLLASVGCVMMSYIIFALASDSDMAQIRGGASAQTALSLGCFVIIFFSLIFLLYTNSFLIKQRRREFGLLNVLGMGKAHIARVMVWEALISLVISLGLGMLSGILFAKLGVLLMFRMLDAAPIMNFTVSCTALGYVSAAFCGIFLLLLVKSLLQVQLSNPIALLQSVSAGEKQPRANYVTALLGLAALAAGYYLSVTTTNPYDAINYFFIAVLLVILGTYLFFISASVAVLKLLRRSKGYYYKSNHFISVSSMIYRMRRNGAGLASICVIITMILVMLSSTLCLNIGIEDAVRQRYPQDICIELSDCASTSWPEEAALSVLQEKGLEPENAVHLSSSSFFAGVDGNTVLASNLLDGMSFLYADMVTLADYNAITGQAAELEENQILLLCKNVEWNFPTLSIDHYRELEIKSVLTDANLDGANAVSVIPGCYIVLKNQELIDEISAAMTDRYGEDVISRYYQYRFDVDCSDAVQEEIASLLRQQTAPEGLASSLTVECRFTERMDFLALYGGLLFLGVLLGVTFLLGAVLIIYYKQVTEGYEDAGRFQILRDVGMTDREIKSSINSQVLTVFFAPLLVAGAHILFAMPLISLLLSCFGLDNKPLFYIVTAAVFVLVCLVYTAIYTATSRVYYSIVSNGRS